MKSRRKSGDTPAMMRARNVELAFGALANLGLRAPDGFDEGSMPSSRKAQNGLQALSMMRAAMGLPEGALTASMLEVRAHVASALRVDHVLDGRPEHGAVRYVCRFPEQAFPVAWQRRLATTFDEMAPLTVTGTVPAAAIEAIRAKATADLERIRERAVQAAFELRRRFDARFAKEGVVPVEQIVAPKNQMSPQEMEMLIDRYVATHHAGDHAAEERLRMAIDDPRMLHLDVPVKPRRVLALLGPTNSGKTHEGLGLLASAASGAYLGPLRLMALENHEAVLARGVRCSLLTGEEEILDPEARHVSATVEMFDQTRHWGTVLVDEIQMLADPDRGWAWSRAFLSASTDLLIVAGSPDAEPLIRRLAAMNGDTVEVRRFERRNALEVSNAKVGWDDLRRGDAIIAFSRDDVLGYKSLAESRGFKAAAIYGALGPEARHEQARRFREGDVDVLVATDAIGMGLNLPIDRVLFTRVSKWDGREERPLTGSETRQVAGRAGRFSSERPGVVAMMTGAGKTDRLDRLMKAPSIIDVDAPLPMQPGWAVVSRVINERGLTLENALSLIADVLLGHPDASYLVTDEVKDILMLVDGPKHSPQQRFRHLGLPLSLRNQANRNILASWVRRVNAGAPVVAPTLGAVSPTATADTYDLRRIEDAVHQAGAYLWLSRRFPDRYPDDDAARETRTVGTAHITAILAQKAISKPCNNCGEALPVGHRLPVCDGCHSGRSRDDWW